MDFLKKIYYQYQARKHFKDRKDRVLISLATYQAARETLDYISQSMPIVEMREMLDKLERCNKSYVSFSELFYESLRKRTPKEKQPFIPLLVKNKSLKYLFQLRKEKKIFLDNVSNVHAAHLAVREFFYNMVSGISVEEMGMFLDRAKKDSNKYVNITEWYIEALRKRK